MSPTKNLDADSDDDDALAAAIADAAEWEADDTTLAAVADAALEDAKEWDADIPHKVGAYIAGEEYARAMHDRGEQPSAAVQMAIASDRSRSPPTRRGGFQSHPPIPKPLPQTPAPRIAYTPRTEPPTTMQWTLSPSANCHFFSQPLEELTPPRIPFDDIGWVAGRRVLKEEEPKPKPKRMRIDVDEDEM